MLVDPATVPATLRALPPRAQLGEAPAAPHSAVSACASDTTSQVWTPDASAGPHVVTSVTPEASSTQSGLGSPARHTSPELPDEHPPKTLEQPRTTIAASHPRGERRRGAAAESGRQCRCREAM